MGLVITAYPPGREASGNPTKEKNSKNIWNVQETVCPSKSRLEETQFHPCRTIWTIVPVRESGKFWINQHNNIWMIENVS